MNTTALSLYTVNPSIIAKNGIQRKSNYIPFGTAWKSFRGSSPECRASKSSNSSITDFDLYELLGIDSSCDQAQIKVAYRALQKRCHPDIAGPPGHDMAIVLNEAYAVLSDPNSRLAYDKEQAKVADLRGYTGKPIYSAWFGSESEKRAVFVDEAKCVGCLKCALFAQKTFAVESVYGRARVVAQWADPEAKIEAAIETCPVDCISIVERSNLAALEFLMSKQPRGKVRIGVGNTVGARAPDVFTDLEKFQARYAMNKASSRNSKESDAQREAMTSAIQTIKAISNWLYWQAPGAEATPQNGQNLTSLEQKSAEPNIKKLRDVAAARKQARESMHGFLGASTKYLPYDEYWVPSNLISPDSDSTNSGSKVVPESSPAKENEAFEEKISSSTVNQSKPFLWFVPTAFATAAAFVVRSQLGEGEAGGLKEHIAGSLIRDIVNSSWLQVILASVTWYLIGLYIMELVDAVQSKLGKYRK